MYDQGLKGETGILNFLCIRVFSLVLARISPKKVHRTIWICSFRCAKRLEIIFWRTTMWPDGKYWLFLIQCGDYLMTRIQPNNSTYRHLETEVDHFVDECGCFHFKSCLFLYKLTWNAGLYIWKGSVCNACIRGDEPSHTCDQLEPGNSGETEGRGVGTGWSVSARVALGIHQGA